jgi:hypothetical protein
MTPNNNGFSRGDSRDGMATSAMNSHDAWSFPPDATGASSDLVMMQLQQQQLKLQQLQQQQHQLQQQQQQQLAQQSGFVGGHSASAGRLQQHEQLLQEQRQQHYQQELLKQQQQQQQLTYGGGLEATPGVVAAFSNSRNNDNSWQSGLPLQAFDAQDSAYTTAAAQSHLLLQKQQFQSSRGEDYVTTNEHWKSPQPLFSSFSELDELSMSFPGQSSGNKASSAALYTAGSLNDSTGYTPQNRQGQLAQLYQSGAQRRPSETGVSPYATTGASKHVYGNERTTAVSPASSHLPLGLAFTNYKEMAQQTQRETQTTSHPENNNDDSSSSGMASDSLLHNSCKCFSKVVGIVRSALQLDPGAVSRSVPTPANPRDGSTTTEPSPSKKRKLSADTYSYPIHIALRHEASEDVVDLLVSTDPSVLVQKDGPDESSALGVALAAQVETAVLRRLLAWNPEQAKIADKHGRVPMHVVVQNRVVSMEMVKALYQAHPEAVFQIDLKGDTPVALAERNPFCRETIVNYLQERVDRTLEQEAEHIDDEILQRVAEV